MCPVYDPFGKTKLQTDKSCAGRLGDFALTVRLLNFFSISSRKEVHLDFK